MTPEEFIQTWGGPRPENPLAKFRQSLQNVRGYAELILETFDDGFRPAVATSLDAVCRECRELLRDVVTLLSLSESFEQANAHLAQGLMPKLNSLSLQLRRLIEAHRREEYLPDLKIMQSAANELVRIVEGFARRAKSAPSNAARLLHGNAASS